MFAVRTPTAISPTMEETSIAEGTDCGGRSEIESYLELVHPPGIDVCQPAEGLPESAQRRRPVAVRAVAAEHVRAVEHVEAFDAQRDGAGGRQAHADFAEDGGVVERGSAQGVPVHDRAADGRPIVVVAVAVVVDAGRRIE